MSTSVSSRSNSSVQPTRQQLDELDALLQRMLDLPVAPSEEPGPRQAEAGGLAKPRTDARAAGAKVHSKAGSARQEMSPAPAAVRDDTANDEPGAGTAEEAEHEEGENWVPMRANWQPSAQTWEPLARKWHEEAKQAGTEQPSRRQKKKRQGASPAAETPETAETDSTPAEMEAPPVRQPPAAGEPGAMEWWRTQPTEEWTTASVGPDADEPGEPLPTSWQTYANPAGTPAGTPSSQMALGAPLREAAPEEKSGQAPASTDEPPLPLWLWPFATVDMICNACLALLGPLGRPLRSPGGKSVLAAIGLFCLAIAAGLLVADWFGWTQ